MAYKKLKTLSSKVEGVTVYSSRTEFEFRRYSIEVTDRLGEFRYVYQNQTPTLTELKDYKSRLYN